MPSEDFSLLFSTLTFLELPELKTAMESCFSSAFKAKLLKKKNRTWTQFQPNFQGFNSEQN